MIAISEEEKRLDLSSWWETDCPAAPPPTISTLCLWVGEWVVVVESEVVVEVIEVEEGEGGLGGVEGWEGWEVTVARLLLLMTVADRGIELRIRELDDLEATILLDPTMLVNWTI